MKPEFFVFIDERYESASNHKRIIVSSVVIEEDNWNAHGSRVGCSHPYEHLCTLSELLGEVDGFGVVTYADIKYLARRNHFAGDIGRVARDNTIWSTTVLSAIFAAMRHLEKISPSGIIDVYYDPQSLTKKHSLAFKKLILQSPEIANAKMGSDFSIRNISSISKAEPPDSTNALQEGVVVAHHLCSNATQIFSGKNMPRIFCENASNTVQNHLTLCDALSR